METAFMEAQSGDPAGDGRICLLRRLAKIGAELVVALGGLALLGSVLDIPTLKGLPELVPTTLPTAICFVLGGLMVRDLAVNPKATRVRALLLLSGGYLVLVAGCVALGSYFVGYASGGYPLGQALGELTPATAMGFILFAAAL